MKKIFLALISFLVLDPVLAQPALFRRGPDCESAINTILTTLQENNNVNIELQVFNTNNIEDAPPDRPFGLIILLGNPTSRGQAQHILNIINSPQLLISLSRNVINRCGQASAVTYAIKSTERGTTIGLVNGQIREFECVSLPPGVNPRNTLPPRWGQIYCR